jgi:hypothetical protein
VRGQEWVRAIQYRIYMYVRGLYTYSEEGHAKYEKSECGILRKLRFSVLDPSPLSFQGILVVLIPTQRTS